MQNALKPEVSTMLQKKTTKDDLLEGEVAGMCSYHLINRVYATFCFIVAEDHDRLIRLLIIHFTILVHCGCHENQFIRLAAV